MRAYLKVCHGVIIDYYKCLFLPAENVDFSSVDVKPESVNIDVPRVPDHLVAGDVLHLKQGVDHGQLVGDRELLVHVHIGIEHGGPVELVDEQWLTELSCF